MYEKVIYLFLIFDKALGVDYFGVRCLLFVICSVSSYLRSLFSDWLIELFQLSQVKSCFQAYSSRSNGTSTCRLVYNALSLSQRMRCGKGGRDRMRRTELVVSVVKAFTHLFLIYLKALWFVCLFEKKIKYSGKNRFFILWFN